MLQVCHEPALPSRRDACVRSPVGVSAGDGVADRRDHIMPITRRSASLDAVTQIILKHE